MVRTLQNGEWRSGLHVPYFGEMDDSLQPNFMISDHEFMLRRHLSVSGSFPRLSTRADTHFT